MLYNFWTLCCKHHHMPQKFKKDADYRKNVRLKVQNLTISSQSITHEIGKKFSLCGCRSTLSMTQIWNFCFDFFGKLTLFKENYKSAHYWKIIFIYDLKFDRCLQKLWWTHWQNKLPSDENAKMSNESKKDSPWKVALIFTILNFLVKLHQNMFTISSRNWTNIEKMHLLSCFTFLLKDKSLWKQLGWSIMSHYRL